MNDALPNDTPIDAVALLTRVLELLDAQAEHVAAAHVAHVISLL